MIRVNLLPQEFRRAAGTPPLLLGLVCGGVALIAIVGCLYVYLWFNLLVVEEELASLKKDVAQLTGRAAEVDSLEEDIRDYKDRERIIIQIKTDRILWSRKLDALSSLTSPEIWITKLRLKKEDTVARKLVGTPDAVPRKYLELECYALGADVKTMTEFRGSLMGQRPFWSDFLTEGVAANDFGYGFASISPPSWEKVALDGFREKQNIRFTIRLDLKPSEDTSPGEKTT